MSLNKLVDVIGKAKNIDLLWEDLCKMGRHGLVNETNFRIALQMLASVRELKRCVEYFHLMNGFGFGYSLGSLNMGLRLFVGGSLLMRLDFLFSC